MEEAMLAYGEAIRIKPGYVDAASNLARLLKEVGTALER